MISPVGIALKLLRERLGLTQEQLGSRVGLSTPSITRYELYPMYPGARSLAVLADFARRHRFADATKVLDDALLEKYGALAPGCISELVQSGIAAARDNQPTAA